MAKAVAKGSRITGAQRETLAGQYAKRYAAGDSIRKIAEDSGRSFGFVHGVLKESGVDLRGRGGSHRGTRASTGPARKTAAAKKTATKTTAAKATAAKKTTVKKAAAPTKATTTKAAATKTAATKTAATKTAAPKAEKSDKKATKKAAKKAAKKS